MSNWREIWTTVKINTKTNKKTKQQKKNERNKRKMQQMSKKTRIIYQRNLDRVITSIID